jgi:hypothetical protein
MLASSSRLEGPKDRGILFFQLVERKYQLLRPGCPRWAGYSDNQKAELATVDFVYQYNLAHQLDEHVLEHFVVAAVGRFYQ